MKMLTEIIGYSSIIMAVGLGAMVLLSPYPMERASAFLDPWEKQDGVQPLVQALAKITDPKW